MNFKNLESDDILISPFEVHKTFTVTSGDASATAVDITGSMEECNKVSFVVEDNDAYVEFDGDATTSSMLIPKDEGYFDDNVYIGTKISIMRAGGTNSRIRGIVWGR